MQVSNLRISCLSGSLLCEMTVTCVKDGRTYCKHFTLAVIEHKIFPFLVVYDTVQTHTKNKKKKPIYSTLVTKYMYKIKGYMNMFSKTWCKSLKLRSRFSTLREWHLSNYKMTLTSVLQVFNFAKCL